MKRASSADQALLGIVSTKQNFVTGRHYDGYYPIALQDVFQHVYPPQMEVFKLAII